MLASLLPRISSTMRIVFVALATLLVLGASAGNARAQALDPSLWETDGVVQTTAIGDGRLYIGGSFGYVGPRTGGFALLNLNPAASATRPPEVNGSVRAMVSDGAGGWYIGGSFSRVAGVARGNGAHIRADGSLDAWDPRTNGPIECLLVAPEGIYVGGSFINCGGQAAPNLSLVNRTDASGLGWTPAPSGGVVRALATDGTNIFIGGSFDFIGGQQRKGFAIVSYAGQVLSPINLNINGTSTVFRPDIFTLVYRTGKLYMGGVIISVNGISRAGAAAITTNNGAVTPWNPNVSSRVRTILLSRGRAYLGGDFQSASSLTRVGVAGVDTLTGAPSIWNPSLNISGSAHTILDDGVRLYVGGSFTTAAGNPVKNLIATDDAGNIVPGLLTAANGTVRALGQEGQQILVGGFQTSLGGVTRQNIAALSLATGAVLPWGPSTTNGIVRTIALAPGRVYMGGTFTNVGGIARNYAAAVDTATGAVQSWNPAPDSSVRVILANGSAVYVGGHFRNCGGVPHKLLALVNNTTGAANPSFDCPLGIVNESPLTLMYVQCLALSGTRLYIGGRFDRVRPNATTVVRNRACVVNSQTGALGVWNPSMDGVPRAIVPTASGIFVGGEFSRPMPQSVFSSITLVDTVGLDDPRFQGYADVLVNAIQANGNTLTLGGIFTNLGNQINSFNGLGRVNWTTGFAGAWVPFPDTGAVETMVLDPATGDLIVGGSFRKMGLNPAFGLARFKGTIPGSPAATVTTPLAGSSIELGSTFRIEWTSSAPSPGIQSADVYVSQTGTGGPWRLLAAGLVGRNSYDWVIDGTYGPSTNNHVRVDVRDWYGNLVSDLTNASFNVFVNVVTDVDPGAQAVFALRPLVPNPVRGSTRVSFVAPKAAHVTLSVLDIQGRTLAVLADAVYAAGTHEVAVDAASLPAGLCFLQMRTPTGTLTRRFVTLR